MSVVHHGSRYPFVTSASSSGGTWRWVLLVGVLLFVRACVSVVVSAVGDAEGAPAQPRPPVLDDPSGGEDDPPGEEARADAPPEKRCIPRPDAPPRPWSAQTGKAGSLVGEVCAIEIFAHAGRSPWTPAERKRELAASARAYDFLKAQARRYEKELRVTMVERPEAVRLGSSEDASMGGFPREAVATAMGRSLEAIVSAAQRKHRCPQAHVVVHAKVEPVPDLSHAEPGPGAELAVVVHRFDPLVIAHEVLHLYGAWDFYHLDHGSFSPQTEEQAQRLARLFPNDIMRSVDVGSPNVGNLTAWLVGWTRCSEPSYPSFEPTFQVSTPSTDDWGSWDLDDERTPW